MIYRGRKAAVPNVGLQVGLQDCPVGNAKARYLLAASHIPCPSKTAMQKMSNKVSKDIVKLNIDDMSNRRKRIKTLIQENCGRGHMNVSLDARYNTSTYGSRHKCGQNASQAIMTAISQDGDEKEIIDLVVENKLCWEGAWLRSQGYCVKCPGHLGCTSTTERTLPLSEFKMGEKIGQQFTLDDILIKHACTDGDARSCEGMNKAISASNPLWKVLRQSDTTHLGLSQYKRALNCNFSRGFFPIHCTTKEQRNNLQRVFSEDIKARCHIAYNNLYEFCEGDIFKMSKKSKDLVCMMIDCYNGNHSKCSRKGWLISCTGRKVNNWFRKSAYFNTLTYKITGFSMSKNDKKLLKEIIKMKLGLENIEMFKFKFNTNKNEAIHRGYSASLPRNVNFSRNVLGRVHSAAHRLNHGPGNSLHLKLEKVGAPLQKGGYVAKAVNQLQNETFYHKQYKKQKYVRNRINYQRRIQRYEYNQIKCNKKAKDMYQKGMLDNPPLVSSSRRKKKKLDHTYSEFDWC